MQREASSKLSSDQVALNRLKIRLPCGQHGLGDRPGLPYRRPAAVEAQMMMKEVFGPELIKGIESPSAGILPRRRDNPAKPRRDR